MQTTTAPTNPNIIPLEIPLRAQEGYNPDNLLDTLIAELHLKNDAALARKLKLAPPVISKLRHVNADVTPAIMVRIHDVTGVSIARIRSLMGVSAPAL